MLDPGNRPALGLTAAWSSGRYLVAWSASGSIAGTRITDDGVADGAVLLAEQPAGIHWTSPLVAALDHRFVLVIRHDVVDLLAHVDQTYVEGVSFSADADLASVATLPRTPIFAIDDHLGRSMFAATNGNTLALAYNRSLPEAGAVTRVFLRLFAEGTSRRRVAH